ncbi:hypothetical protein [Microbacterium sp.]|jgi:hypothetical protein
MLMNCAPTRITATRSALGGVVAIPVVTVSLGAFSGHRAHTGS